MAAGVRVLFVDCCGEHLDGAQEKLAILGGRFFQAFDVLLDVAGHVIEGFGQFANFRGATDHDAFVKFRPAHGASGFHQAADGARDAERKNVSEKQRDHRDHHDEL